MLNKIREEFGFPSIDDNNTACIILMTKTELRKSLDFVNEERDRLQRELEDYKSRIEKATNELFELKDMIYKPETRDENMVIQQKISSIIKQLNGRSDE